MQELNIKVKGMMCNGCENRVQNALKQINGVEDVKASHVNGTVDIIANGDLNKKDIIETIQDIGYEVVD